MGPQECEKHPDPDERIQSGGIPTVGYLFRHTLDHADVHTQTEGGAEAPTPPQYSPTIQPEPPNAEP